MPDSIFTRIVRGDIPAQIIYEDQHTLAFLDHDPVTYGHTLVIPKQQIDHLDDCSEELYTAIFATVQKVSKQLKMILKPHRIALIVHGYEIPHAHVYVLPSYTPEDIKFPPRPKPNPNADTLNTLAAKLRIEAS